MIQWKAYPARRGGRQKRALQRWEGVVIIYESLRGRHIRRRLAQRPLVTRTPTQKSTQAKEDWVGHAAGQPAGAEKLGVIVLWIEIKTADGEQSHAAPTDRPGQKGTETKVCHWSRSPSHHPGSIDLC